MNVDSLLCCVSLATMSTNVSTVSPVDVHSWRRERRGRSDRPGGRNKPHTQGLLHAFTDFRSRFGNVSLRSSRCLWTALYQHFNFVQESQNLIENHTKTHRKQAFIRSRGGRSIWQPQSPCRMRHQTANMNAKTNEARAALVHLQTITSNNIMKTWVMKWRNNLGDTNLL